MFVIDVKAFLVSPSVFSRDSSMQNSITALDRNTGTMAKKKRPMPVQGAHMCYACCTVPLLEDLGIFGVPFPQWKCGLSFIARYPLLHSVTNPFPWGRASRINPTVRVWGGPAPDLLLDAYAAPRPPFPTPPVSNERFVQRTLPLDHISLVPELIRYPIKLLS